MEWMVFQLLWQRRGWVLSAGSRPMVVHCRAPAMSVSAVVSHHLVCLLRALDRVPQFRVNIVGPGESYRHIRVWIPQLHCGDIPRTSGL